MKYRLKKYYVVKWILSIVLLIAVFSCADRRSGKVGQYVYIDPFMKIHVDRECAANSNASQRTKDERIMASRGVDFIDTCSLHSGGCNIYDYYENYRFCPGCVDDETYHHLMAIIDRNQSKSE